MPFATEPMAAALRALVKFYRTGETEDRRQYDIAWVRDKASPVDTINGFIEVYHGRPRHQGRVGGARLLREPREDRGHPEARARSAVVRGSHALGSQVPQGRRAWHHRQRHRRRHRNGRLGPDHAGRHQSAERPGDSRDVREQVGVALERRRGLRAIDRSRRFDPSSRGPPRRPRAARSGAAWPAS